MKKNIPKNSRQGNKRSTKHKIIKSAETLFSKYGYASVSMDDIAKEVKISKAALYYHFDGKEKLFLEMMEDEFAKFEVMVSKSLESQGETDERLRKFIVDYMNLALKEENFVKIIIQKFSPKDKGVLKIVIGERDKIISKVEPFIGEIFREKGFGKKCDNYFIAFILMGVLHSAIANELISKKRKWNAEYIADQILLLTPPKRGREKF